MNPKIDNLKKAESMASFKIIYQKNRKEKNSGRMVFDELGYYQQMFEEVETVRSVFKENDIKILTTKNEK